VESTRSIGPELPRGKLGIPRGEVPFGYIATDSLTAYCFVYRFVWRFVYCSGIALLCMYCFAAESIISLTHYRLLLYLCCEVDHFVSALPFTALSYRYNAYQFVNALPLCLCIKIELLIAPMVMLVASQVPRTSDIV